MVVVAIKKQNKTQIFRKKRVYSQKDRNIYYAAMLRLIRANNGETVFITFTKEAIAFRVMEWCCNRYNTTYILTTRDEEGSLDCTFKFDNNNKLL